MLCPSCQFDNPSVMRFCGGCGQPLAAAPATAEERRHLTVMFCDLVDSTGMAERLDPEEMLDVIQRCQAAARLVVQRYDGHIAQYLGDGILVYFGYPTAHEDDASRAVRAALEILETIDRVSEEIRVDIGMPALMRIGIHAGLAVTGVIGGGDRVEHLATGSVPNTAARVQAAAEPGQCLISGDVLALLDAGVACTFAGTRQLKGIAKPTDLYLVEGLKTAPAAAQAERTAFVGREEELARLLSAHEAVRAGEGRLVLLSGEAGMGKSRLGRELVSRVADAASTLVYRCAAYQRNTPFAPLLEALPRQLGLRVRPTDAGFREAVRDCLAVVGLNDALDTDLMVEFLSTERAHAMQASPVVKRRETRRLLAELILRLAEQRHRLVVFEDLHWADPSSLDVVDQLGLGLAMRPALVICSHRPGFEHSWPEVERLERLTLAPFTQEAARAFVEGHRGTLSDALVAQILDRSDGVPLFLEELSRAVREAGADVAGGEQVPISLRDSLMSRLDSLGSHKEPVQIGALIGRRFDRPLLEAVSGRSAEVIEESIARAVAADLILPLGGSQTRFVFRHALIQEIAYDSLLRQTRRRLHGAVADALAGASDRQVDLYALHLDRAERYEEAAQAYYDAGRHSSRRSAYVEAQLAYDRALDMLGHTPATQEVRDLRFALLLANTQLLTILRSYSDDTLAATYEQARNMLDAGEVQVDPFEFYVGYWGLKAVRCEVDAAGDAAAVLAQLAEASAHPRRPRVATFTQGCNAFYLGEIDRARNLLERAVTRDVEDESVVAGDVLYIANLVLAWSDALHGDVVASTNLLSQALEAAQRSDDPFVVVQTLCYACAVHEDIGSPLQRVMDMATSALELSERYGFSEWLSYARMHRAYVSACQGDLAALGDLEEIVEGLYDGNSDNSWAHSLYTLAEAQLKCGNMQAALESIERAIAVCEKRVGRYIEPDCHRIRGELLILLGRQEEGVQSLQRSLALARRDGAHYLAMRALCSLIDHAPAADKQGFRDALGAVLANNIRGETPHIQAARSRLQVGAETALRSLA